MCMCFYQVDIPLMTGREAVQFFASCNHSGKIKSLYFNLAPSRHFAPYDLVSVPKAKVSVVILIYHVLNVGVVCVDILVLTVTVKE